MKPKHMMIFPAILAMVFSAPSFSHSEDKVKADYDPIETEFGSYEPDLHASRTVEVRMNDNMRFSPEVILVKQGEALKLIHHNDGKLMHEFVLGTPESLLEHAEMMKKFPTMEHAEPYMAHVPPGEKMEMIWKFSNSGEFAFACLIPGHFDAGMKGIIIVD